MDNSLCNFKVIQNPSKRYANTVNIVFFKASKLVKNFQEYLDGLEGWQKYSDLYPHSQVQLFIDRKIYEDEQARPLVDKLTNARIYLFECPELMNEDGFHKGLFATMIRFFPMFDINKHAFSIAHIQELEPTLVSLPKVALIDGLARKTLRKNMGVIYTAWGLAPFRYLEMNPTKFEGINYSWIFAGRFTAMTKVPFKLLTDYVEDLKSDKKMFNKYSISQEKEHEQYTYGVDETFLNFVYLPWLIKNNFGIGIIFLYGIYEPIFSLKEEILNHKDSKQIFDFILGKKQHLRGAVREFIHMFYEKKESDITEYAKECASRFFTVIKKYPNWLGHAQTRLILRIFKDYLYRNCLVIIRNNKIEEIIDM